MSIVEEKTAHMRVTARGVAEGEPGRMFFADPTRARFLIARGEAELTNAGNVPRETSGILKLSADWPWDRFSTVTPGWDGKVCAIFGGGPSLTLEQVALVKIAHAAGKAKAICINDSYLWCDWADVLYFADSAWHRWHSGGIQKPRLKMSAAEVRERFEAFAGEKCSIQSTGMNVEDSHVHLLRNYHVDVNGRGIHGVGLSLDPGALVTGRNSGWQALNLAVLAGAKTIILLGFDAKEPADGPGHWHGEHPEREPIAAFAEYRKAFSQGEAAVKAAGVRVINCSPDSAIGFEKISLDQALVL